MEIKKVIYLILLIVWMITVFMFSSEKGETSGNTSGKIIKTILKIFRKDVSEENIKKLQLPIRKLAHFTLYGVGGVLAIALLNQYDITIIKKIIYSQLIISLYAATDEFHQKFIPGRTGCITDVLIDSAGALTAILLIAIIFIKK